jgi:hypothetical protein
VVVAGPVVVDATVVVGARVVVVGPVVGGRLVVDTMLVVVTSVVVGAAVVGAAVVVGLAVVDGAVAGGWVVLAEDGRALPVVAPTLAGAGAVAARAVVAGPLMAPCSGPAMVDGEVLVVGSRSPVAVVVDADVGAGRVGAVGSATPGVRGGGWGWGSRVAEATTAARIAVVSPKMNSSSRQGRRGLARCRGGGIGMGRRRPGSAGSSGS